jgi:hypothetical protein
MFGAETYRTATALHLPLHSSALARTGDYECCQGFIAFDIEQGEADGVALSGRRALFVQDAKPMMVEGN